MKNGRFISGASFKKKFYKLFRYCKVSITKTVLSVFISFLIFGFVWMSFREIKFENFAGDMLNFGGAEKVVGIGVVVSDREEKDI